MFVMHLRDAMDAYRLSDEHHSAQRGVSDTGKEENVLERLDLETRIVNDEVQENGIEQQRCNVDNGTENVVDGFDA